MLFFLQPAMLDGGTAAHCNDVLLEKIDGKFWQATFKLIYPTC
jgi:hypothetical protein